MTLLPSLNGNKTWTNTEIQTSLDSRLTGVKRLATLDPNFFFRGCILENVLKAKIKSACLFTTSLVAVNISRS